MGIPSDISEDKWLNKGGWEVIVLDKNIARIANAVQVTICLLVSTSVY